MVVGSARAETSCAVLAVGPYQVQQNSVGVQVSVPECKNAKTMTLSLLNEKGRITRKGQPASRKSIHRTILLTARWL